MAKIASTGILYHPGGGGAQYPYRLKPFRPRNLWRRTPGPRPPGGPARRSTVTITFIVVVVVAVALLIGLSSDWFGLSDSDETPVLTVSHVESAGFIIEENTVDGRAQVLAGAFEGIRATVMLPLDSEESLSAQLPEAERAADSYSQNVEFFRAGESLVICDPVPECSDLVLALAEAVFRG